MDSLKTAAEVVAASERARSTRSKSSRASKTLKASSRVSRTGERQPDHFVQICIPTQNETGVTKFQCYVCGRWAFLSGSIGERVPVDRMPFMDR
eukprot:9228090-Karenia_brevis.AAC.1